MALDPRAIALATEIEETTNRLYAAKPKDSKIRERIQAGIAEGERLSAQLRSGELEWTIDVEVGVRTGCAIFDVALRHFA